MAAFSYKKYPRTYRYFNEDFIALPSLKPEIATTFGKHAGLTPDEVQSVFCRGTIPVVTVINLTGLLGWTPPKGEEINLDKTFIEELESLLADRSETRSGVYAPSELETNIIWILEATVLHEMVHFFRKERDEEVRKRMMSGTGRAHEELVARQFEADAYAGRQGVPQSYILGKWMPRTMLNAQGLWPQRD